MNTILYMAITLDGKISGSNEDTSWVEEEDIMRMDELMKECGVMIMGRKTYDSFGDELLNDAALQIVFTHNPEYLKKIQDNVRFTNKNPIDILKDLEEEGFKNVLLAGGGVLNSIFLEEDLIDEVRLIVKPIVLGEGKNLFIKSNGIKKFNLLEVQQLVNNTVELKYKK